MKKIINGVRYNTDKAIEIGSDYNNVSTNDFSYWDATLYKTPRSGRFFLAGKGGPMTRFGLRCDDGTSTFGSKIIPMSKAEAMEWAEQYLDIEEIEKHFDIEEA